MWGLPAKGRGAPDGDWLRWLHDPGRHGAGREVRRESEQLAPCILVRKLLTWYRSVHCARRGRQPVLRLCWICKSAPGRRGRVPAH